MKAPASSPESSSLTKTMSSASLISTTQITYPTPSPAPAIAHNIKISQNQAKVTDLRQTNPPLKAEIFNSSNKFNVSTENVFNLNRNEFLEPEAPKPPMRRNKNVITLSPRESEQIKNGHQTKPNYTKHLTVNQNQNENIGNDSKISKPVIVFRNRSTSSPIYDNHMESNYDQLKNFNSNNNHVKTVRDMTVRNGICIEPNTRILSAALRNSKHQYVSCTNLIYFLISLFLILKYEF